MKKTISLFSLLLFMTMHTMAQNLTLGPLFTDHAILQQGQSVPVWGTAAPKTNVTVMFGKVKVKAKADGEGNWKVMLPASRTWNIP